MSMTSDARYALRNLARSPGFTAVAALTLALGIGATTAIFSAVDALLLRSLPYPDGGRLVMLWSDGTLRGFARQDVVNPGVVRLWSESLTTVESVAGFNPWGPTLAADGDREARRVPGAMVSHRYFETLRVPMARGRDFMAEEDVENGPRHLVISHGFWQRELGGTTDAVGRSVPLNGEPWTVVGILPPGFVAPSMANREVFRLIQGDPDPRGGFWLAVLARLKPGVTVEQADAELDAVQARLAKEYAGDLHDLAGYVQPLAEVIVQDVRTQLLVLLGATAFVLLIACANLANLLLARASGRARELAVRAALGAGRARLVRQLLTESCVLAVLGALAGLGVAVLGIRWIEAALPDGLATNAPLMLDLRVLGFALVAALASGLLFGSVPAVAVARHDLVGSLRDGDRASSGGRGGARTRSLLVIGTFALALGLTAGAGLFLKSLFKLQSVEPGFRPTGLLTFTVALPQAKYPERSAIAAALDAIEARLAALPGVESVGFTSTLPLSGSSSDTGTAIEGVPLEGEPLRTWWSSVTPGYLATLNVPLERGRHLRATDRGSPDEVACVLMVNRTYVDRYLAGGDAVGRRILLNPRSDNPRRCEIVGIVGDLRFDNLAAAPNPTMYLPSGSFTMRSFYAALRVTGEPLAALPAAKRAVAEVDPGLAFGEVATMTARIDDSLRTPRLVATLTGAFAALALLLAALGVYGVLAYTVGARTREFGVRLALGAQSSALLGQVMGGGLRLALAGVALGAAFTLAIGRSLAALLYEVEPFDLEVFAAVGGLLVLVAALAALLPAWRASRVDPIEALRYE